MLTMSLFVNSQMNQFLFWKYLAFLLVHKIDEKIIFTTRKHPSSIRTDRAITRMTSDRVAKRPIVDRQTRVKTLPSLAVGKYRITCNVKVPQYNSNPTDSVQIEDKTWLVFFTVIYPPVQFFTVAMVMQLMSPAHWWDRHHRWQHLYSDTCSYRNRKQVLCWSGNRRCMHRNLCLVVSRKGTWHQSNSPDPDEKINRTTCYRMCLMFVMTHDRGTP